MEDTTQENFGNYLIKGIDEVIIPEPVSFWPQTIGWKILALAFILYLLYLGYRRVVRWHQNRYRRAAIGKLDLQAEQGLDAVDIAAGLPWLLKATALQAYPRTDIASLSGASWRRFLNSRVEERYAFDADQFDLINRLAYQQQARSGLDAQSAQQIIERCRQWIKYHQVCEGA